MKKMIVLLALAMTLMAAQAFADTAVNVGGAKGFVATKNVNISANKSSTLDSWAAVTCHTAGDKEFATTSAMGGLAFKTVTPGSGNGTTAPSAPTTATDTQTPSNYATM